MEDVVIDPAEETTKSVIAFLGRQRLQFEKMSRKDPEFFKERIDQIDEAITHLRAGAVSRAISLLEEQRLIAAGLDLNMEEIDVVTTGGLSFSNVNKVVLDQLNEWLKVLKNQLQS